MTRCVSADELMSDAIEAFYLAMENFDLTRGVRFSTYLVIIAHQRVARSESFQDIITKPHHPREVFRKIYKGKMLLESEGVCDPSSAEIAERIGLAEALVKKTLEQYDSTSVRSFDYEDDDSREDFFEYDPLLTYEDDFENEVDVAIDLDLLLSYLPQQMAAILQDRYLGGMKLREISEKYGKTREWVRQILDVSMFRLRQINEAFDIEDEREREERLTFLRTVVVKPFSMKFR